MIGLTVSFPSWYKELGIISEGNLLEGDAACCSGEKLPLSCQQNKVFLCSEMILIETEELLCRGAPSDSRQWWCSGLKC